MKKSPGFTYNAAAGSQGSSSSRHPFPASSTSSASAVQSCSDYSSPRKRKLSLEAEDDDDFDDDEFDKGMIEAVEEFELSQVEPNGSQLNRSNTGLGHQGGPIPIAQNGTLAPSLQERVCVLDGENKILRSEKERLMEELRMAREQMALMKLSYDSRQKNLEDQLQKQEQAQSSSTAFLKQEVQDLQSKLNSRRTVHTQPVPCSSKSALSSTKHRRGATTSPEIEQGFPLSENFLSSSPVSASQIKTVHVTRKPTLSTRLSQSFKMPPSKKPKTSHSDEEASSSSKVKLNSTSDSPSTPERGDEDFVGLLDVSADLSGPQLLRLLVHKELLKFPSLKSIHRHRANSRAESRNHTPNLLSLLHHPSRSALSATTTPSPIYKTPTSRPPAQKSRPVERITGTTTINSSMKSSRPVHETKHLTPQNQEPDQDPKAPPSEKSESASTGAAHFSLQDSMASLLKSSDRMSFNASNPEMPEYDFDSHNTTSENSLDPSSPDGGISLLYIMDSVISTYYTSQMKKYHSSFKNMPVRSLDQLTLEEQSQQTATLSSSTGTGPSTANSGTCNTQGTAATQKSSRSSNTHCSVADAEKHQVLQALQTVRTLVSFSKPVSKALFTRPPLFCIDGEGPSEPAEATATAAENQEEGKTESQETTQTSSSNDADMTVMTASSVAQFNTKVSFLSVCRFKKAISIVHV